MNDLKFTTPGDFVANAQGILTEEKIKGNTSQRNSLWLLLIN